jgi:hypothetical protein
MDDTAQFVSSLNVARFVDRLRVEHDPAIRRSLNRLLLREWDNLGINLGQLGNVQREVIEGRARIAVQIAVAETMVANGQDARLAESMLSNLIDAQRTIEQYRQIIVDAMNRNDHQTPPQA